MFTYLVEVLFRHDRAVQGLVCLFLGHSLGGSQLGQTVFKAFERGLKTNQNLSEAALLVYVCLPYLHNRSLLVASSIRDGPSGEAQGVRGQGGGHGGRSLRKKT